MEEKRIFYYLLKARVTDVEWIFQTLDDVEHFRIIQKRIDKVVVLVVPGHGFSERTEQYIVSILQRLLGMTTHVEVKIVDKIPSAQKFRFIISKISQKYFEGIL